MTTGHKLWTAVILAGQRPGIDPLADHFGTQWKALVPIDGQPMLSHVASTLLEIDQISQIFILGQHPDALRPAVPINPRIVFEASNSGISTSILKLIEAKGEQLFPLLVTTADHPLLTINMVRAFLSDSSASDLSVAMVEKTILLERYPENRRTWLKFRDGWWSGANLFALTNCKTRNALTLWAAAEQDRKKVWKLFFHFGPWLALRALTRTIGLADALSRAGNRLGMSARLVALPYAEAAIDVDKPSDHELAQSILRERKRT